VETTDAHGVGGCNCRRRRAPRMAQPAKPKSGSNERRRLTLVEFVVVIAVIIAAVSGGCGGGGGQSSTGKGNGSRQAARDYIKSKHRDTNTVQASVQSLQAGLAIMSKSATPDDMNSFAQLAQQAHDFIDGVRNDFATSDTTGALGNAEVEVFAAANDLKNAMGAVVAYTGDPNPATLAHFTSLYQTAVSEWNDGIRTIWRIAGERGAPTV